MSLTRSSRSLVFGLALGFSAGALPAADLALTHGKTWTGDTAHPHAEAMACVDAKVAAVGTAAEVAKWTGRKTKGHRLIAVAGVYRYEQSHHLFDVKTESPGEAIVHQEEPGVCAYFIQEGQVEVVRSELGQDRVIATLGKDRYFGEMALLSNAPRNATVRALKETRVAALGKENFVRLLDC
ncbi:MAG TPA: cyclic nucleotide-binding domain-containing protein [Bryobacteraceae bacterium]|nr:cyclic nucleotide-binding domain-containing protein [Bryobacteraceae bacterium]